MRYVSSKRRVLVSFLPLLLAFLAFATSSASANEAWWHLTSGARPTYLKPGLASDEVQEILTTQGTEPIFGIPEQTDLFVYVNKESVGPLAFGEFGTKGLVEAFPTEVTLLSAENLQKALEKPAAYGAGNVTVKEESVDAEGKPLTEGRKRYLVTTIGQEADREVPPLEVKGEGSSTAERQLLRAGKFDGELVAGVENIGDAPMRGGGCVKVGEGQGKFADSGCTVAAEPGKGEYEKIPVRILDTLPAGLEAVAVSGTIPKGNEASAIPCEVVMSTLVTCEDEGELGSFASIELRIGVLVKGSAPANAVNESESNEIVAEGGQASPASLRRPVRLSAEPVPFGVEEYQLVNEQEGGAPDRHAGSHPFQQSLTIDLNQTADTRSLSEPEHKASVHAAQMAKTLRMKWPAGLIGNPLAVPRCPLFQFLQEVPFPNVPGGLINACPADTAVGVQHVTIFEPFLGTLNVTSALFNLEPQAGEAARFGFTVIGVPVRVDIGVRSGEDYGVTVEPRDITQSIEFISSTTTVWGDPGAAVHTNTRGNICLAAELLALGCSEPPQPQPAPFLALPTSCPGEVKTGIEGDSWEQADEQQARGEALTLAPLAETTMPALDGCNQLPFEPSITVKPDLPDASSSTGMTVNVKVPQEDSLSPEGLADADIRDTTVMLPAGVAINPSGGDGLESCPNNLIGYQGTREFEGLEGAQVPVFSPHIPGGVDAKQAGEEAPLEPGINFCSNASKIGTARIKVPVLEHELTGAVYLAPQEQNPFGSLLAMYIVAEDPVSGVLVKLPGEVTLCKGAGEVVDGQTCQGLGQIVTTFLNTPQAPAEEIELHFFGGEKAPLATPDRCGAYTTTTSIEPWSGNAPAHPSATFQIEHGPGGGPCPGAQLPFHPSLTGGATNIQAGAFSPFTLTLNRSDGEQNMQSVEAHLPLGMSGDLSNIEQCPEPQANEGACGPNSLIGETTVAVGVGGKPFTVSGGKFYLTGPYNGYGGCGTPGANGCAPFGITFVVPAKAGPFDLAHTQHNHPACDCVLVRGKIEINPETAAISVTSNPPGTPDAIPTSIEGIPLEIQHINATTTRGNFQFNPTNCSKLETSGTIHSSEGATDTIHVPFQVTNCASLKFEPKFHVSTAPAKDTRLDGASLTARLAYPSAPQGTFTNIARVKVELPRALPSRLNTLRKACTVAQFDANPAGCPSASKIGMAVVHTPILAGPLTGPAIFVSHGGEAWPTLTLVLQGDGVTVDLVGTTLISKAGVTSTTFKTVPDQPFSTFELTLPQGEYSALTTLGNLCRQKLTMPTEFTAQNGAQLKIDTKIEVRGCGKAKKAKHRHEKTHRKKKHNDRKGKK